MNTALGRIETDGVTPVKEEGRAEASSNSPLAQRGTSSEYVVLYAEA